MSSLAPDAAVDAASLVVPHVAPSDLLAVLDAIWPVAVEAARGTPDGHRWVLVSDDEAAGVS